ncbi:hypothetical protein [Mesorhizobium sp. KR1-2]|uniref:hypothetical protein n=1 Tax=Mesorhizobium sp. KR1-2 TaxID=3156609 RepID=UPI0032B464D0
MHWFSGAVIGTTAFFTGGALAADLQPIEGVNIDLGSVSGSAYYTVERDGYSLVATLASGPDTTPVRFISTLLPGQGVILSVPKAEGGEALTFEVRRIGDRIEVTEPKRTLRVDERNSSEQGTLFGGCSPIGRGSIWCLTHEKRAAATEAYAGDRKFEDVLVERAVTCWTTPTALRGIKLEVDLAVSIDDHGDVNDVTIQSFAPFSDTSNALAQDFAMALKQCSPYAALSERRMILHVNWPL